VHGFEATVSHHLPSLAAREAYVKAQLAIQCSARTALCFFRRRQALRRQMEAPARLVGKPTVGLDTFLSQALRCTIPG
jgi:hypothetical protein